MVRLNNGIMPLKTLFDKRIGIIDLKNRVLLHNPKQHHEPDRTVNIHRHAENDQRKQTAWNAQWNGGHDCERVDEAVEL